MDAVEEHVNRALIKLYFAIAEFESSPLSKGLRVDEPQKRAIASALQAARDALETSAQLSGSSSRPIPQDELPTRLF